MISWPAIKAILFSTVLSTCALLGLAWFLFRSWAGAKIKADVESTYAKERESHRVELRTQAERELERYRSMLEQERDLQAVATRAFASAHSASAERCLDAVQRVWDATTKTRNAANKLMLLLDIFTRKEIETATDDPRRAGSIGAPTDKEMTALLQVGSDAECARPFVSEPLWALFIAYRTVLGRILVKLKIGREQGSLQFWIDDAYTARLLASVLEPSEVQRIQNMQAGGIKEASRIIEQRIVEEARRTIIGEASSDAALKRARSILELARAPFATTDLTVPDPE